jgi:hypothetical protein
MWPHIARETDTECLYFCPLPFAEEIRDVCRFIPSGSLLLPSDIFACHQSERESLFDTFALKSISRLSSFCIFYHALTQG